MKTLKVTLLSTMFVLLWCSCGPNETEMEVHSLKNLGTVRLAVVNSLGENISLIGWNPLKVLKNAATVGQAPNHILLHNGEVWVLSSLSHSLEVLDATTWTMLRQYSLGIGCNPYMMALTAENQLVVTCQQTSELLLVNPLVDQASDPVLKRLAMPGGSELKPTDVNNLGQALPQGVAVVGQKAYVTLTNLGSDWKPAGPGFVQVVDIGDWQLEKLIELESTNAVSIHYPPSGGDKLYVSCATTFDGSGSVAVVDVTNDSVSTVYTGGAPGRMWVDTNQTAWVGDMLDGRLLRFSINDGSLLDPVVICPADFKNGIYDFISDVASNEDGIMFAACFATDTVHIFNSQSCSCGVKTVPVGDGPQSLLVLP